MSRQKTSIVMKNKWFGKMKLSKNLNFKNFSLKLIFFNEKKSIVESQFLALFESRQCALAGNVSICK